ncbi:MAG: cobyric acid synthase [bacterium]|nr:cobyric acid synthase [bacterium]
MGKALMIQGTTSNAGKSLTVAAICRILAQDGYSVAPFKSQNMALNSFITHEGLEMGRAQVMQAEAAGIEPLVAMNPILLKPTGDTGSQIIVNGEVTGNMSATDYFDFRHTLRPKVMEAFDSLASTHDFVIIEGAGSPAEINLKKDDIVNMGMAKMAKAPVLIVGDIDRGGVFASLYGTVALLDDDERTLVKGTIINKFRGDKTLLDPGLVMLEDLTGVPCLGVIPYMHLDIDDEDSLSDRIAGGRVGDGPIDIAVVRLSHLSNFTDTNPLSRYRQLSVRYVDRPEDLRSPDLIILPGTKNTMDDMDWLVSRGLDVAIRRRAAEGALILGICGGYQLLGERLDDPEGVEHGGSMAGLGLLPMRTVFTSDKRRTRVDAITGEFIGEFAQLSGKTLTGYEIHMGATVPVNGEWAEGARPFATLTDDNGNTMVDGCVCGNVIGSYCHGMFEDGSFGQALVGMLCERKGVAASDFPIETFRRYKDRQYDELAATVRESIDMELLMRIIEEGVR